MKKKSIMVNVVLVLSVVMLSACGGLTKEDYLAEWKEISEMNEKVSDIPDSLSTEEMCKVYRDALDELEVRTMEGEAYKKDMEDLLDFYMDNADLMDNSENYSESEIREWYSELSDKAEQLEHDAKELADTMRACGIDADDLNDLHVGN